MQPSTPWRCRPAPGNWECVYGTDRFLELFAADHPAAPWGAIAANVYYATPELHRINLLQSLPLP